MADRPPILPSAIDTDEAGFSPAEVEAQLARIRNSPEFNASEAQRAFLHYVIAKALAGRADEIKGYTIATEVFGRPADFDQAIDPVVSIQANKLRRALERYYLVAGQADPIRIDIPKGSYVPTFEPHGETETSTLPVEAMPGRARVETSWPSLAVHSLSNLTGNPELDQIGVIIASEIALEITRCQEIIVFIQSGEQIGRRSTDSRANFVLSGSVHRDTTQLKMNLSLTDPSTGRQLWADAHHADLDPAHLLSAGEEVARIVAGKIAAESGIIARHLAAASRRTPAKQLTSYEALLRYYEFHGQFTQPTFHDALAALRLASEREPECALVWSMLARLHAVNYANELFDPGTPIDTAVVLAQTGARLDPADQRIRLTLAYTLMLADELPAARTEADRALALNPNSFIFLENIGYVLTLLGDWTRGCALIQRAIAVNPYYSFTAHYALWLDQFRRRAYPRAYQETLNFRSPNLFWDHLAKAATLGQLGRIQEGRKTAAELLRLKPDFPGSGMRLIRRYVKFEEIAESIADGLGHVGIVMG